MDVTQHDDRLHFGERLIVSFHRTLRLPEDGNTYPLPPGFGLFPVLQRAEPGSATPVFLVPIYRREALWIGFSAPGGRHSAVKIIAGGINAVSGLPDAGAGLGESQDYLLCPDQPWLDGCNIGDGVIRQFIAMPLGQGYGLGAATAGGEQGGLEVIVLAPLPGRVPDTPPPAAPAGPMRLARFVTEAPRPQEMTLGAGGRMRQKIYPDRFGRDAWDLGSAAHARLRLVEARDWPALTGQEAPATPVDAAAYTRAGLPWFDIYDEGEGTIAPAITTTPRTVGERDRELGIDTKSQPLDVNVRQVTVIGRDKPAGPTRSGT